MKTKKLTLVQRFCVCLMAGFFALHGLLMATGCDGGGGGAEGRSTVQGRINSFSVAGRFYMPAEKPGLFHLAAGKLIGFFLPDAHAAVGGVTVSVQGTDISGTTDDRGDFVLSGVPGGLQVLVFTYNGVTSTLEVNVPGYGKVELSGVNVTDGGVTVREIEVEEYEDEFENENEDDDDNGNDNSDDNENEDDDDDNGNDNDD